MIQGEPALDVSRSDLEASMAANASKVARVAKPEELAPDATMQVSGEIVEIQGPRCGEVLD